LDSYLVNYGITYGVTYGITYGVTYSITYGVGQNYTVAEHRQANEQGDCIAEHRQAFKQVAGADQDLRTDQLSSSCRKADFGIRGCYELYRRWQGRG